MALSIWRENWYRAFMMRRFDIFLIWLLGVLVVDRTLKLLAQEGQTIDLPVGRFVLVENHGAVFSWPIPNAVATTIMWVAIMGLVWYAWRLRRRGNFLRFIGAILMIVGAASNLYDRLVYGFVIDWAYLGPWWPVFNLADVMIGVGVVVLVWPRRRRLTVSK